MSMTQIYAFEAVDYQHMTSAQLDALGLATPIVLDLNGDGVKTTSSANGVMFDLMGTGTKQHVGWASASDGLLVMDRNGDGIINDGKELFGTATLNSHGARSGNGFAAMATEDTNQDGKLSAADAHFNQLKVWVDANHNGVTDAGELKSLSELGIVSVDLHANAGATVENGNLHGLVSSYTTSDGAKHEVVDVWFGKESGTSAPQVAVSDLLASPGQIPGLDQPAAAATATQQPATIVTTEPHSADSGTAAAAATPTPVATPASIDDNSLVHHSASTDPLKNLLDDQNKNLLI
jgi:hypothetical protein